MANELLSTFESFSKGDGVSLWGSVNDAEEAVLKKLVQESARFDGPIIEVGTLFGFTTQLIASTKAPDRPLVTIDNYCWNPFHLPPEQHLKFTRRALRYCIQHSNVSIYDGSNATYYANYTGPRPSMIFIDADHTYEGVLVDLNWAKKMRIPLICGHDHTSEWPGIVRAVKEVLGPVDVQESVWIYRQAP